MPSFEQLNDAAYHNERVAARRLALKTGLAPELALRQTLQQAAGADGLPALLAARAAKRQRELAQRTAKQEEKAAARAAKTVENGVGPLAWRGWFDGSAHPNPGRIGIGALLTGPDGQRIEISRAAGHGNSGEAEYLALIALLEAAATQRPAQLLVYGDSQVVINDVKHDGAQGAKGLEQLRSRAGALLALCGQTRLTWIPRHRNGAADALSQRAAAPARDEET